MRQSRGPNRGLVRLAASAALFGAAALLAPSAASPPGPSAATAAVPAGFVETTVFTGLTNPTVVRFASDGRVFVAEKSGLLKVFDNLSDTTPTVFADLRTNVHNFWDRGLLGMALHPAFPSTPYVYVLYTYDHVLGDSAPAPRWGSPGATSDGCPSPPGATSDGCVVSGRLSRLQASGNTMTGAEQVLVEDWCQQYPSHSVGSVEFGSDGALYASAGDGASFNFTDWGQDGSPVNPCGDPPGGVGATLTPPTAAGGALRSQDLRTPSDPTTLDGSVIRVDAGTGAGLASNPLFGSSDANARRIIADGLRNPFRFTFRPGTSELWLGDVGWGEWEEINRIVSPTDAVVENFGWPCYEGNPRQGSYDGANLSICENLYAAGNADTKPYHAYRHADKVVVGETCPTGSSSIAGLAFEFAPQSSTFPSDYQGALFFADYSRDCIWAMRKSGNPIPSPGHIDTFVAGAANPVNLEFGPDGNLYYVDFDGGTIRRVAPQDPQPSVTGRTPAPGATLVPVSVSPTATFSEAMNPATLTTSTFTLVRQGETVPVPATVSYANLVATLNPSSDLQSATTYTATLKGGPTGAKDLAGNPLAADASWTFSTASTTNQPPTPTIVAPATTFTWKVGDTVSFSGTATDPEQGALPAAALSWRLLLQHCPSNCHTHTIQTWGGVASGSFAAPDHEYPSYLDLELTATDAGGASATTTRRLDPQTVTLDFASSPAGLQLAVNAAVTTTPFSRTVIRGSTNTVSAPSPQSLAGTSYAFASWSDGGAQTHTLTANASASYTATYTSQGGGSSYSSTVLADSPLAYWRLGEASGSNAADASGNGRSGSYLNTPSLGQVGALTGDANSAVGFNGSDEYVNVPYTAALNPSQFTVEAWAYPTGGQGTWRSLVSSRDYAPGAARGYILYAGPDNRWQLWTGSGAWNTLLGPAIVLNQWTHLVGTYDGSSARLYVNGTLAASSTVSYVQNAARPLRIAAGRSETTPPSYFLSGRVDEVAVYGSPLSPARVQAHFAASSGGGGGNQAPVAVASGTPTSGAVPLAVSFTGSGSSDPDGTIAAYAWDLDGDGAYDDSSAQNPSFTYTTAGTYSVRLQVTDNQGAQDVSDPVTITATGGGGSSYSSTVLADSPLAYWRLGEASGSNAADASGNGRSGSYLNTPSLGQVGALTGDANSAVGFNGSDEYVNVPYTAALNPSQFTVEAWAYPTGGQGTWRSLVSSRDYAPGAARGYILYAGPDNRWQLWTGSGAWNTLLGPAIVLNQWTHLVGTYDGSSARLYVNGTLAASSTVSYVQNAARPLRIAAGRSETTPPSYFLSGRVDEVAVYGSPLSPARVQAHFAASSG